MVSGWLAAISGRLTNRVFLMNDNEAFWRGWQVTRRQGGFGRAYRDPLFDTLTECARCRGAGAGADEPCIFCLGTGRTTVGEVCQPCR